jgi:hypothetical protein
MVTPDARAPSLFAALQSARRAVFGSTRDARRAGSHVATFVTSNIMAATAA